MVLQRPLTSVLTGAVLALSTLSASAAGESLAPPWAYPVSDANAPHLPDDGAIKHVPGSAQGFTQQQIGDWFPDEHPPMPDIVAKGRRPSMQACDICHLPTGQGHPESAYLTGEPAEYFFRQVKDYQSGKRRSIVPERSASMTRISTAMTDDEIKSAAAYYASLRPTPWVTVKESDSVPVTYLAALNMRFVKPGGGSEPLGKRIIEFPEDTERAYLRDPHSPFIAYVPPGSIEKGKALVAGGQGKTVACGGCHGADLRGKDAGPPIAGLHPIYIFRQLLDMQQGARNGDGAQAMKPAVMMLSEDDMLNISAYIATQKP